MTEISWAGKYKDGKKVAPIRIALPFQTIETVNESAADRNARIASLFAEKETATDSYNRLIWGDKKYVLPSLLPEFAGKIKLIYIDPPFDTGANFSFSTTIPQHEDEETLSITKQPSVIEQKAYRDTWGRGLDSYLQWFYETCTLLRELLAEDGSIYVHLDWHVGHYAKCVLDEVFGYENFRNEVIVNRTKKNFIETQTIKSFNVSYDSIMIYGKSDKHRINPVYKNVERDDRWHSFDAPNWSNTRPNLMYELFGKLPPQGRCWVWLKEKADLAIKEGRLRANAKTGKPEYLIPASDKELLNNLWTDFNAYSFKFGYPTEKNEVLLERVITAGSNEGDLVLDCFCGSGTTAAVAEKLKRKWLTCDLGRFAIHTARKRLLGIAGVTPFVVQNLGKYERQQWMKAEFEGVEQLAQRIAQEKAYRKFMLDLYNGSVLTGAYSYLHGVKAGRMVHIGSVDSPITTEDVKQAIREFWKLSPPTPQRGQQGGGIDFLGWEFAFDLNETAQQMAAENKVLVKFKKIPREVLEKKAVEQGDIKFYELAALSTQVSIRKREVTIALENFILPPDEVSAEVQGQITHWSQWVDYWAIDWNYQADTFHNEWQSYRTKQHQQIELSAKQGYEAAGTYTVLIKVVDILGNDTTKTLTITI